MGLGAAPPPPWLTCKDTGVAVVQAAAVQDQGDAIQLADLGGGRTHSDTAAPGEGAVVCFFSSLLVATLPMQ